jgi:hypothetical protein
MTTRSALSTVHRGVAFEERSRKLLRDNLSMSLCRVGGKSDGGIDLQGWWWLPVLAQSSSAQARSIVGHGGPRHRLRVLAQCKAEKKKLGPNYVREMEGVIHRQLSNAQETATSQIPSPHHICPTIALIISESTFTKATLLHALSSPVPIFLLHLPSIPGTVELEHARGGKPNSSFDGIGSAFWNPALAGEKGLLRGEINIRWERSAVGGGRPGLWRQRSKIVSWTPDVDNCSQE